MRDYAGIQTRFEYAVRRSYQAVDKSMPQRIAKQLIDGKHIAAYGFDSARTVVMSNVDRITRAIVVRSSARLVKHQKANCATVNAQTKVRNSVDGFVGRADELHALRKHLELLTHNLSNATSNKQRRNIQYCITKTNEAIKNV